MLRHDLKREYQCTQGNCPNSICAAVYQQLEQRGQHISPEDASRLQCQQSLPCCPMWLLLQGRLCYGNTTATTRTCCWRRRSFYSALRGMSCGAGCRPGLVPFTVPCISWGSMPASTSCACSAAESDAQLQVLPGGGALWPRRTEGVLACQKGSCPAVVSWAELRCVPDLCQTTCTAEGSLLQQCLCSNCSPQLCWCTSLQVKGACSCLLGNAATATPRQHAELTHAAHP